MLRLLYILIFSMLLITPDAVAQKSTAKSIRKQKQTTQQEINETNKKIKDNTAKIKSSLNDLNLIEADIRAHEKAIKGINKEVNALNRRLKLLQDSIDKGEKRIKSLTDNYARAIRNTQGQGTAFDNLLFIFSAESVRQAHRRMRYLQQFSQWRTKQVDEIRATQEHLKSQQTEVKAIAQKRTEALNKQNREKAELENKRKQQSKVVKSLKKEGKSLRKVLAEKQRKARQLDDALNRLIAEEERKAREEQARKEAEAKRKAEEAKKKTQDNRTETPSATTKKDAPSETKVEPKKAEDIASITGTFESNKGKLMPPVEGSYKIVRPFGRHKHPELKYVQTDNGGIDIEVEAGSNARAIFDGKVTAIFPQDGFNTVVMVRHGNYLTIYVNLSEIFVSNGQMVKANQAIGKIFSDPDDNNRTILHFEVRKEREKLNPQDWLKQ